MVAMLTSHVATDENHVSTYPREFVTHRQLWSLLGYATFAALVIVVFLILR
jgi:hypothetical protein